MSEGLLRVLRQQERMTAEQEAAWQSRLQAGERDLAAWCFAQNIITPQALAEMLADLFRYPLADLAALPPGKPPAVMDEALMHSLCCLPLKAEGQTVWLAVSDPTAIGLYRQAAAGFSVNPVVVRHDVLLQRLGSVAVRSTAGLQTVAEEYAAEGPAENEEDGPVARFVYEMLEDALRCGVSDIHFEFYEDRARVRFRIDGRLQEVAAPPVAVRAQLASRIKVMARLDIAEKRVPQDGRIRLSLPGGGKPFDVRVSTLPTVYGEKAVMRILNAASSDWHIDRLGLEPFQKDLLLDALNRPHGMILVTGPTGSGKTVSLYACLNLLNTEAVNIATAEDPVEINLSGVNQVNVNDRQGLTFAAALRAFLRQDPDIIMVGEIRDLETADIAVKAAQTGHLVFSTLHTNSAPATLSRLLNMGVAPFNIAGAVSLIAAQRLLRRLCPDCKKPSEKLPENVLRDAGFSDEDLRGSWRLYRAQGCPSCSGRGYKGRIGVFEIMPVDAALQRVILAGGHEADIRAEAVRAGMVGLRRAALFKAMAGETSLEEVLAVTNKM